MSRPLLLASAALFALPTAAAAQGVGITPVAYASGSTGPGFSVTSPIFSVGVPASYTPPVAGGLRPYTYAISGTLPAGLTFTAATGAIGGTPTATGSFGLVATDAAGTATTITITVTAAPTGILRAASPSNQLGGTPQSVTSGYNLAGKLPMWIGSGDMSELRVVTQNFGGGLTAIQCPGNAVTVNETWLVSDATGQAVRVTWGGSNSLTMADCAGIQYSDPITPAAFKLGRFARDSKFWITDTATPSGKAVQHNFGVAADAYAISYNPSVTIPTNVAAKGAFTYTGTAPTTSRTLSFMLAGRFVVGDPRTAAGIGDSIVQNIGDYTSSTPNSSYAGYFGRSMWTVTGVSGARGAINFGFSGGTYALWADATSYAKLKQYLPLVNTIFDEYGTNSFTNTNTANGNPYRNSERALWTAWRADAPVTGGASIYIIRSSLGPRSSGAWTATDGSDQAWSNLSTWAVSGDVDLVNTALAADAGVAGRFDKWIDPGAYTRFNPSAGTSSADFHRWAPGLTADGVHPSPTTAETIAANALRPALQAADAVP